MRTAPQDRTNVRHAAAHWLGWGAAAGLFGAAGALAGLTQAPAGPAEGPMVLVHAIFPPAVVGLAVAAGCGLVGLALAALPAERPSPVAGVGRFAAAGAGAAAIAAIGGLGWAVAAGLAVFATSILWSLGRIARALYDARRREPVGADAAPAACSAVLPTVTAGAVALVLAVVTTVAAGLEVAGLDVTGAERFELIARGGGHLILLAAVLTATGTWLALSGGIAGRPPVRRGAVFALLAVALLPWMVVPRLPSMGVVGWHYSAPLADLARWDLHVVPLVLGALCLRAVLRAFPARGDDRAHSGAPVAALVGSIALVAAAGAALWMTPRAGGFLPVHLAGVAVATAAAQAGLAAAVAAPARAPHPTALTAPAGDRRQTDTQTLVTTPRETSWA